MASGMRKRSATVSNKMLASYFCDCFEFYSKRS